MPLDNFVYPTESLNMKKPAHLSWFSLFGKILN